MRPIQYIFIVLLVAVMIFFERRFKKQLVIKLGLGVIFLLALTITIVPDASTLVANALGIVRGVDLIIYLSLLGLLSACLLLYLRVMELERKLTALVRTQALESTAVDTWQGKNA